MSDTVKKEITTEMKANSIYGGQNYLQKPFTAVYKVTAHQSVWIAASNGLASVDATSPWIV